MCLIGLFACQSVGRDPLLKLTFRVVDDEGQAVEGAKVSFSAEARPKYAGDESGYQNSISGSTNDQGNFGGELEAWDATRSGYTVTKDDYYPSWSSYSAKLPLRGKWQPWNPTIEVVLKRIKHPVPMYAKRVEKGLPNLNESIGYDLEAGDWVSPHGKGKIPDMVFRGTLQSRGDTDFDFELKLTFSNPGDGIQRFGPPPNSEVGDYRSLVLYEAPVEGYDSVWILKRWRRPDGPEETTFDKKSGYFFRVRSVLDEKGRVVKALYGKIYGDFFYMRYYLNPDGTRNIEYDPKRNLLKAPTNWDRSDYEVGP